MKRLSVFLILLIMVYITAFPAEKTMTIGKCTWLTEQNSQEEVGAAAEKEKKPVLTVFSATWCGPCQDIKKNVFTKDEFRKVADKAVLLYIEQTEPKGMEYVKKYQIIAFPTFKILDKEGVVVDTESPERTVEGFLKWLAEVEKGNHRLAYEQRLEKNPGDRDAMVKMADKFDFFESAKKIEYLEKAIGETPDYSDPLTKQACEKIIGAYMNAVYNKRDKKKKEDFLKECDKKVLAIFAAYMPDRFEGVLKGPNGYSSLMNWHIIAERPAKAVEVYNDYMKGKELEKTLPEGGYVHATAASAYLKIEKSPEALDIYKKIKSYCSANIDKLDENFVFHFITISRNFMDYYLEKKEIDRAKEFFAVLFEEVEKLEKAGKVPENAEQYIDYLFSSYATQYGVLMEEVLKRIDKKIEAAGGNEAISLMMTKAKLLFKKGEKEKAKAVILDCVANEKIFSSIDDKIKYQLFNSLAWTLHEFGLADEKALRIAEKSVALKKAYENMDTLACIHADMGNYKKAIEIEEEALKLTKSQEKKAAIEEQIANWKKSLSEAEKNK